MSAHFVLVTLLSLTLAPAGLAQISARPVAHLDRVTIARGLARVDSSTKSRLPRTVVGASIGGVLGAALGYELALLGHRMYCEGSAQCATRPDRAIRESVRGGIVMGGILGGVIGWKTGRTQDERR